MMYKCKKCGIGVYAKNFDEIVENKKLCKICIVHGGTNATKIILKDVIVKKKEI